MRKYRAVFLLAVLTIAACHPTRGCVESSFALSEDSRLPVWFQLPSGLARKDVIVRLDYWGSPLGRSATLDFQRVSGGTLGSVVATLRGDRPLNVPARPDDPPSAYPTYEVLTVGDRSDVVEHRRGEPVFYMCDDPVVRQALGIP